MKESLKSLNVSSSGLEMGLSLDAALKKEEEFLQALEIVETLGTLSGKEQEEYFKSFLSTKPHGYVSAKRYLANAIKFENKEYAYQLLMSACLSAPIDHENYLCLAELAIFDDALTLAKDFLGTAKWLCEDGLEDAKKKIDNLLAEINIKFQDGVCDNSNSSFWLSKTIDRFWILEKLFLQAKHNELQEYAFQLLDKLGPSIENFFAVFQALTLIGNEIVWKKFDKYIEKYWISDEINKKLLKGLMHHALNDYQKSILSLQDVLKKEPLNSKARLYMSLNYLFSGDIDNFISSASKILPEPKADFIAVCLIYSALSNLDFGQGLYPDHKNIAKEISLVLEKLMDTEKKELVFKIIEKFKELGSFEILPCFQLYVADLLMKYNMVSDAKKILEGCKENEVHRLYAWICRVEGNSEQAEKELTIYRKNLQKESEFGIYCKVVDLDLPGDVPESEEEILKSLQYAYKQTHESINKLALEYGLDHMTCVETRCQDCCTKTFPFVTYTEYLYLRKWLVKQPLDFQEKIIEASCKIVQQYKDKYKKDPPFLIGEKEKFRREEYPSDFIFSCPFLGDNKCNVYEVRPFTCRAYSFSSFDGIAFKGCRYFFEELKQANMLDNTRKVINAKSFFNFATKTDEKLIGKKIAAPLPVWFSISHDELMNKLKNEIFNAQI